MYNNFSSKKTKKVISALLASALVVTAAPITADAATTKVVGVSKTFSITKKASAKVSGLSKAEKKVVKVTISKNKKKVTVKGLKAGSATFKVGKKAYTVRVTKVTSIKKKTFATTLTAKKNKNVSVTVNGTNVKYDKATWTSSNKKVVTVKSATTKISSKKVASNTLKPLKKGTATITVKSKATGKSLKVKVTVKAATTATTAPTTTPSVTPATTPAVSATPDATASATPATTPAVSATPDATATPATTPAVSATPATTPAVSATPEVSTNPAVSADPSTTPENSEKPATPEVVTGGTITVTTNVTGVAIKVSTGSTVVATTTTTTSSGAVLANIPVGTYEVEVSADGYVTKTEIVTVDGDKTVDFKLVEKATVASVVAVDNKKLYVEGKNLDQIKAENVKVGAKTATELSDVDSVKLRKDGSLFIVTKGMTAGTAYTVQIAGQTFTAIAKPADSDALTVNTVTAKSSTLVEVAFNEDDADKLTLLDKDNYVFDKGLKATDVTYKYDANGDKILGTVYVSTTAQTAGEVYTLTINGVSDLAGNVIEKDTKKTFAGIAEDKKAPTLVSVGSDKGNKVTVTFNDASMMDAGSISNVANYTISGLEIKKATVITNELTGGNAVVELETSEQTIGKVYTLKANNIKDIYGNVPTDALELTFAGTAIDKDAPKISTVTAQTNTTVSVVFDDKMNEETATNVANYAIDNGLSVVSAKLNTDKKSANYLQEVVLTTTAQSVGAVYELTVSNVTDAAGNVISNTTSTDYKKTFAGVGVDTTAPTVSVYTAGTAAKNKVTLQFSEAVDEKTAKEPTNYKIEGLGYPTAVSFDETNNRVTLTTAAQSNGAIYKITINNIADKAGNVIKKDTEVKFAGIGNVAEAAKISSATAINNKQIKVIFNKAVKLTPGDATAYFTLTDSASTPNSVALASTNGLYKIDDKTYIITIGSAEELDNQIYTLTAVDDAIKDLGDVELSRADSDDYTKKVGGVTTAPSAPKVVAVTQRSAKTLEVTFDQELYASASETNNVVLDYADTGVADLTGATAGSLAVDPDDATKAIVTFTSNLTSNQVATLKLTTSATTIKDKTNNFAIEETTKSSGKHDFKFGTTNYTASTVKVSGATAIDEQTVEVTFNQAVDTSLMDASTFAIKDKDASSAVSGLTIKSVKQTASNKVRIYFSTTTALTSGTLYSVVVADNNEIKDLDGTVMSSAADDVKATFGANNAENPAPELISAIPLSDTVLQVAFSEPVTGLTVADLEINVNGSGSVGRQALTGSDVTVNKIDKDGAVYTVTVQSDKGSFVTGNTYELFVDANANTLTDINGVDDLIDTDKDGKDIVSVFGGVGDGATITASLSTDITLAVTASTGNTDKTITDCYIAWGDTASDAIDALSSTQYTAVLTYANTGMNATKTTRYLAVKLTDDLGSELIKTFKVTGNAAGNAIVSVE